MSSTLRNTLPYTLALAVIAFVLFYFVSSMSTALTFVAGVLACGILVPILADVKKQTPKSQTVKHEVTAEAFQGDTATLYVGNLPYRANEDAVKELFGRFGTVINVRLMKDRQTGRRRGFGFVEVAAADANNLIGKLNDFEFQERTLKVREARDRQDDESQAAE